jgi:hypothetical protein
MHRTDAKLVAHALDLQFDIGPVEGQLGRDTHGLGISVLESFGGVHVHYPCVYVDVRYTLGA